MTDSASSLPPEHEAASVVPGGQTISTNAAELPQYVSGRRALSWWGIFLLILIELAVFATLISSYFYLRAAVPVWPPDGIAPPDLLLPTLSSLLFLLSVAPIAMSVRRIKQGDRNGLKRYLAIAFGMGLIFLILKAVEYNHTPYTWTANAYGSIVWTTIGFHATHVLATLFKVAALWVVAHQGFFNEVRHSAIEGNAMYWYFGAAIWVPLYIVLYWSPRWL